MVTPTVALWSNHSHLPAAAVKEAEGQTHPPAPWTSGLWGLLLPAAPGITGQSQDPNSHKRLWAFLCLQSTSLMCFNEPFLCFFSQTRDVLHFSEDEDAVIVGSLDFGSEYIDDCPWVSVTQYTPQEVRGQPDGAASTKDTVCENEPTACLIKF